jgi:hypothetical protein
METALLDGHRVVIKRVEPLGDWVMRGTHDEGRIALLWEGGTLARLPEAVDHAVLGVEEDGGAWVVIMRDVSNSLVGDGSRVSRMESATILEALAALHDAFRGQSLFGLCSLEDRYTFLSPATALRESASTLRVPRALLRGWQLFAEVAPSDVVHAVSAVHHNPHLLTAGLRSYRQALVHGDCKMANIALSDPIVLLDWGALTGLAPAETDYAWYVAINCGTIDASLDELIGDCGRAAGSSSQLGAMRLALFGALVQLGWEKALNAYEHPDPEVRRAERDGLAWWYERASEAMHDPGINA